MPTARRKSRTARSWPRGVWGSRCGRWNTARASQFQGGDTDDTKGAFHDMAATWKSASVAPFAPARTLMDSPPPAPETPDATIRRLTAERMAARTLPLDGGGPGWGW